MKLKKHFTPFKNNYTFLKFLPYRYRYTYFFKEDDEDKNNQSSLPLASFNYINSIVGSGIIGMSYALNKAGKKSQFN